MICDYVYTRGKYKGQQCLNNAYFNFKKNSYCGNHYETVRNQVYRQKIAGKGFKAPRVKQQQHQQKITLPAKNYDETPSDLERKLKFSLFMITINTNKDVNKMSSEDKAKFKHFINKLYDSNKPIIIELLEDRRGYDPKQFIHDYEIKDYFEVSPTSNRLHNHALLRVQHNGMLYVNQAMLREMADKVVGSKVHLNVRGANDSKTMIEQYIKKSSIKSIIDF